jgi:hypothetical protein
MGEYQAAGLGNIVGGVLEDSGYQDGTQASFRVQTYDLPDGQKTLRPIIGLSMSKEGLGSVSIKFKIFHEYLGNGEGRVLTADEAQLILLGRRPNNAEVRYSYDRSTYTSYGPLEELVTTDSFRGTQEVIGQEVINYDTIKSIRVGLAKRLPYSTGVSAPLSDYNDLREYGAICQVLGIPSDRRFVEEQMRVVGRGAPINRKVFGRAGFRNIGKAHVHSREEVMGSNKHLTATTKGHTYGERVANVTEIWAKSDTNCCENSEWVQMLVQANSGMTLQAGVIRELEKAVMAAERIVGRALISRERKWVYHSS